MDQAGRIPLDSPRVGAPSRSLIAGPQAPARHPPFGCEAVSELRHDLAERHEWWLIEQYMGQPG